MHLLILASIAAALAVSGTSLAANCPVGGSEHSVGDPGPGEVDLALDRFQESIEIEGERALVRRNGYCPEGYGPQVTLVEQTCDVDGCTSDYDIEMRYVHPTTGHALAVSASLHVPSYDSGPFARGFFSPGAFDVDALGLGTTVEASEAQSELLMGAIEAAGIQADQIVMGASNLVAGRLQCNRIVYPGATAQCKFTAGSEVLPVEDVDVADQLQDALLDLDAMQQPILLGNSRTNAALVRCSRGVYPGAKARCSLVIEI